ncbi:LON peptidase substrate-binding domain-containing protein [Arsukibacterium sp.]|uniref:LON peptidase substrate-binding domain-containing protein n=1 Tax=Arsukibacterium sp. TaxID=1977258 RepID=UPI002FDAE60E
MSEQLALFPLNQFLMPAGKMKLRVFEPRYVRLVREAAAGKRPFAIALLNPFVNQQHPDRILSLVTRANIDDFEQLPDGLLGITISGVQRMKIISRWQEQDKLHVADCQPLPGWSAAEVPADCQALAESMQKLLLSYPQLQQFYPQPKLDDASWLAGRWLELMPMQPALKQQLAATTEPEQCLAGLKSWFEHNA